MTYIEPRLGALAFRISDWPETPTVCDARDAGGVGFVAAGDLFDLGHDPFGALHRGGIGQLHVEDQIALVLLRNEAGRRAVELPVRQHQQAAVGDADDDADAQHPPTVRP